MFLGELTVLENIAKGSPGPVYKYEDEIKYKSVSKALFFLTVIFLVQIL